MKTFHFRFFFGLKKGSKLIKEIATVAILVFHMILVTLYGDLECPQTL